MGWFDERDRDFREEWRDRCKREGLRLLETLRGDTLSFATQVKLPQVPRQSVEAPNPPIPQNVTGWFFWFTAKYYVQNPDAAAVVAVTTAPFSNPTGGVISITNAQIGLVQVTAPARGTVGFPDGVVSLQWDFQGRDLAGATHTTDRGVWLVWPDVTNAT